MRPSSLPMLRDCPEWESCGGNADTDAGELRHAYLNALLDTSLVDGTAESIAKQLPDDDREAVEQAADYVRVKAPTSDHPLRLEYHVNPLGDDFQPLFENGGTLDVSCGPFLFDLKNKERDYLPQMAAYALAMFQEHGWPDVEVHLWFADTRRAQVFKLTEASAHAIVDPIIAAVRAPDRQPRVCEYCGWCAKKLTCPAQTTNAGRIAAARDGLDPETRASFDAWLGAGAHTSDIQDPALMGAVLRVARGLKEWCEAAEFAAREMATKDGKLPAGYKLQSRQGNRFITSVAAAFPLAGLPQADFLKACDVKLSSLVDAYAAFHGQKKAPAERDLERKLGEVIQRKPSTVSLVADKKGIPD